MILKHQKGRGKKIHLLLDDEYQITTDVDFWAEFYIKDGTDVSEADWAALVGKINDRKAMHKALDLLSRRSHSCKELHDKLLRTVDEASAGRAVEKMLSLGYLDDEKYAQALVRYLLEVKKYSVSHVRQECFKRGLDRVVFEPVLSAAEVDGTKTVLDLLCGKYRTKLQQENGREKVTAALLRKGFSYSDIASAFYHLEQEDTYV